MNPADYPPNWKEISQRIRFERAGGRCECIGECGIDHGGRCDEMHGQPAKHARGKVCLTVAHLDHNPASDDETRLRAYCNKCHLRYDVAHHLRSRRKRVINQQLANGQIEMEL